MVVENSELYSSDEEESNDQQQQQDHRGRQRGRQQRDGGEEDDSRLKKGFVRVAWYPKGDEQVTLLHHEVYLGTTFSNESMTLHCLGGEGKPTDTLRSQFDARGCREEVGEG